MRTVIPACDGEDPRPRIPTAFRLGQKAFPGHLTLSGVLTPILSVLLCKTEVRTSTTPGGKGSHEQSQEGTQDTLC